MKKLDLLDVFIVGLLIFVGLILMVAATTRVTPAVEPDPRVEWEQHDVSLMLLVNPYAPDSTRRVLVLPQGATLLLPRRTREGSPRDTVGT